MTANITYQSLKEMSFHERSDLIDPLPVEKKASLLKLLKEAKLCEKRNFVSTLFPDKGPLRRELYPRHMEFFKAGKTHNERAFVAGNRTGKTIGAGSEASFHMTGEYPCWWEGRVFQKPVTALIAGNTSQTTFDILQKKMVGPDIDDDDYGTGLIPFHSIKEKRFTRGQKKGQITDLRVRHVSGGYSNLMFRSYDQGRRIFEGFELDIAWMDEEVPEEVYTEAYMRTMTTKGIVMLTFTPLKGLTPLILSLFDGDLPK